VTAPLLQLDRVTIRFGGLTAVNAVDLTVGENELVGLIGPNGAGKTTVFNVITGVYAPTDGQVAFCGRALTGLRVNEIVALGLARTFQNIRLFDNLSVFDNVRVACNLHRATSPLQPLIRQRAFRDDEAACARRTMELLELFNLRRLADMPAKSLPYGEQRRLEIVRCLATRPKLLLLDEPAAGMNPSEKARTHPPDPACPKAIRPLDLARRAFDESGHGRLSAHRRARLRSQNRRGQPGANSGRPEGHRGVPR